jgi:hypothetical protein
MINPQNFRISAKIFVTNNFSKFFLGIGTFWNKYEAYFSLSFVCLIKSCFKTLFFDILFHHNGFSKKSTITIQKLFLIISSISYHRIEMQQIYNQKWKKWKANKWFFHKILRSSMLIFNHSGLLVFHPTLFSWYDQIITYSFDHGWININNQKLASLTIPISIELTNKNI